MVDEVRRRLGVHRAGHAGTLDPAATGLLIVAVGRATRLLEFLLEHDKAYDFEVELGVLTETDDAEGAMVGEGHVPSREELEATAAGLGGEILQKPPKYSAIRVGGKRLYTYAREGREVEVAARPVTVRELELLSYDPPRARFRLVGSKGIYVRALARDLGGHVVWLRRTRSGPFRVEEAGLDLLPMDAAVRDLPELQLSREEAESFVQGKRVEKPAPPLARVYEGTRFLGIGRGVEDQLKPRKVLAP